MPRRIQYAKKHETLISQLVRASDNTGPFESKAKCLIYAASFGASFGAEKGRMSLPDKKGEAIRYDIFQNKHFEELICALSMYATEDVSILGSDEDTADKRVGIFEEFANFGLEKLDSELRGEANKTDGLALHLSKKYGDKDQNNGIDWSKIS